MLSTPADSARPEPSASVLSSSCSQLSTVPARGKQTLNGPNVLTGAARNTSLRTEQRLELRGEPASAWRHGREAGLALVIGPRLVYRSKHVLKRHHLHRHTSWLSVSDWGLGHRERRSALRTLASTRVAVLARMWASTLGPRPSQVVGLLLGSVSSHDM